MGVFSGSGSGSCPPEPANQTAVNITGSFTLQQIIQIVGWSCFGATVLLWIGLLVPHFRRYKVPNEQRQIFRLITMPVVFSLVSVVSTHTYASAEYIAPVANLYEAFALVALFLLYVEFVAPHAHTREEFFANLENRDRDGVVMPGGSFPWFQRSWRIVFLYLPFYFILVVIQWITQATGVYCATSSRPKFAHIWLQIFELGSTIVVILTILRFQRRLKHHMIGRQALPKLIAFKLLVILTTLQHFIFSILASHVTGSNTVTYQDITIGIPALLICVEAVLCQFAFFFFFHSREYREHKAGEGEIAAPMGAFAAFLHALNPIDILRGIGAALRSFRH